MEKIEAESKELIKNYPLISGLTSISNGKLSSLLLTLSLAYDLLALVPGILCWTRRSSEKKIGRIYSKKTTTNFFSYIYWLSFPSFLFSLSNSHIIVIHHFPQIKPFSPTLFPSTSNSNSNQQQQSTIIPEPLFNQYASEISVLLSTTSSSSTSVNGTNGKTEERKKQEEEFKFNQLKRIQNSLRESQELEDFFQVGVNGNQNGNGDFGGMWVLHLNWRTLLRISALARK